MIFLKSLLILEFGYRIHYKANRPSSIKRWKDNIRKAKHKGLMDHSELLRIFL
jgi:hypothetical protein